MAFPKKRRHDRSEQDSEYFQCYSDITVHEEMLSDTVRTYAYKVAISRNQSALLDKTVLDVGAGTGILSVFCAQAGASKVYAVEASAVSQLACDVVKENGMEGKIEVITSAVENVEIPGKVDAIVSEWMGYGLMYESMLSSVLYARDRWLKPGGLIFPSTADIFIAPVNDTVVESRLDFWSDVKDMYGVDMTCVQSFARKCIMSQDLAVCSVYPENVLSHPVRFASLNLTSATQEDIGNITGSFQFHCFGSSLMHGFVIWFSVTFPGENGVSLTTSPYGEETHWKQTVLYLDEEVQVQQDTEINGEIKMSPSEKNPRHLCVTLSYSIGSDVRRTRNFQMGNGAV
ncbi:protein arginine N-methyltransferase 6 [Pseudophryne corroboree]|uniref:protein arginine N-methyltransferase 6 n=1 Tax=Pseudophryne corroboree TaxID=495146 RepID=UPI003081C49C